MSNLAKIAAQIPDEYRKEMLELNMIDDAVAVENNQPMHYLCVIWKNYVEADFEPECNLCRSRVLKNMRAMKNEFIQLEKNHNLLQGLEKEFDLTQTVESIKQRLPGDEKL